MSARDTSIDDACGVLRNAYYASVKIIADEARAIANLVDRDMFVHESVDGSEWVICPQKNRIVALVSEFSTKGRDDADIDTEMSGDAEGLRAYYAMCADVERLLSCAEATA